MSFALFTICFARPSEVERIVKAHSSRSTIEDKRDCSNVEARYARDPLAQAIRPGACDRYTSELARKVRPLVNKHAANPRVAVGGIQPSADNLTRQLCRFGDLREQVLTRRSHFRYCEVTEQSHARGQGSTL
ncbi:hypothetical protein WMF38_26885 [Sorangium sp. So ce118]